MPGLALRLCHGLQTASLEGSEQGLGEGKGLGGELELLEGLGTWTADGGVQTPGVV